MTWKVDAIVGNLLIRLVIDMSELLGYLYYSFHYCMCLYFNLYFDRYCYGDVRDLETVAIEDVVEAFIAAEKSFSVL